MALTQACAILSHMPDAAAPDLVRVAHSVADDPELAVREVMRAMDLPDLAGVILFCSSRYPIEALGAALSRRNDGHVIIGCTSSGRQPDRHRFSGQRFPA
jgi:hypothetical protein